MKSGLTVDGNYTVGYFDIEPLNISKEQGSHKLAVSESLETDGSLAKEVDRAVSHLSEAASIISTHEFEQANLAQGSATHDVDDEGDSGDGILSMEDERVGNAATGAVEHLSEVDSDSDFEEGHRAAHGAGSDSGDRPQPWPLPEEAGDVMLERDEERGAGASKSEPYVTAQNGASDDTSSEHSDSPHSTNDDQVLPHEVGLGITHHEAVEHGSEHWDSSHDSEPEPHEDTLGRHDDQDLESAHAPAHAESPVERMPDSIEKDDVDVRDFRSSLSPSEMHADEYSHGVEGVERDGAIQIDINGAPSPSGDGHLEPHSSMLSPQMDDGSYPPNMENPEQQSDEISSHGPADNAPAIQSHLVPGGSTADSDSQAFFTPLASAGIRSPARLEQRTLADELDYADDDDSDYFGGDHEHHQSDAYDHAHMHEEHTVTVHDGLYTEGSHEQYQLGGPEEHTTTVEGQDTLFDYDDHSVDSSVARSESPILEHYGVGVEGESRAEAAADMATDMDDRIVATEVKAIYDAEDAEDLAGATRAEHDTSKHHWADETQSSLNESNSPSASLVTPPLRASQTPPTDVSQFDLHKDSPSSMTASPSANRGLAASRHNPGRPQTPTRESLESSSHEDEAEGIMPRDVTNMSWDARNSSTPRSLHSQSTISSAPSSPTQQHSLDNHDPDIRHSWQTSSNSYYTGRPRGDSTLTDNSGLGRFETMNKETPPPMPQWQAQESFTPGPPLGESYDEFRGREEILDTDTSPTSTQRSSNSTGGSLFQKMRSVFENPSISSSQRPASFSKSASASQRNSQFAADNEDDDDSDERSSLLNHGAGTRMSAN
ncbi:hypothetical protein B0T16DRAFT_214638 [Cercophora newfieldiana]|uniref:Uncharacterized protein n=1 Tax=Cercophora newfieldiana TaxID=92897 RepID=A0AA39XWA6_9PEZI|nr:hypothetical protein B0T16DRAFT_214638 [Cercophora newfieldiana]